MKSQYKIIEFSFVYLFIYYYYYFLFFLFFFCIGLSVLGNKAIQKIETPLLGCG